MKIPTIEQANDMLNQAEKMNPGPWVEHCKSTANNAKLIAEKCVHMNADSAYVFGLLHDIGRREGFKDIMHIFDGYYYLSGHGFDDAASICLTHSFPMKDIYTFFGKIDCTQKEISFLQNYLEEKEYTDYDKLVQVCDAISMPRGAVVMEKRFVDVATRHGLPDFTLKKWQSYLKLKEYFDDKAKCNIYTLLPNIIENTFN